MSFASLYCQPIPVFLATRHLNAFPADINSTRPGPSLLSGRNAASQALNITLKWKMLLNK